ncbi:MAG: NIPSNAP family protein [Spirosomataceae bacterium]
MKFISTVLFLIGSSLSSFTQAQKPTEKLYELRIYHCLDGKLPNLVQRFENHTTKLFEKHGMENIGYWLPTTDNNHTLYYVLAYPSMEAREKSWQAFIQDSVWKEVAQKSEENGKIIERIESVYLNMAPNLSKKISPSNQGDDPVFELRTYTCLPGRLPALVTRFEKHTRALFEKHKMTNIAYFTTIEKDQTQPKLVYWVAHKSTENAQKSWDGFRQDPTWITARDASEETGKIVEKVESIYMKPTRFSPLN